MKTIVVSLHDHPPVYAGPIDQMPDYNRQGRRSTAFEALSTSCVGCGFATLMDEACMITSKSGWNRIDILCSFGMRVLELTYSESNALGTESKEDRDGGLTYFCRQCVGRLVLPSLLASLPLPSDPVACSMLLFGAGFAMSEPLQRPANSCKGCANVAQRPDTPWGRFWQTGGHLR